MFVHVHLAIKILLYFLVFLGSLSLISILRGLIHGFEVIEPDAIPEETDGIQYVGHATTLIQMDGLKILTDPILTQTVSYLIRRFQSVGLKEEVLKEIDLVVISHWHSDHFEMRSLKKINRNATILVPKGLKRKVERKGFRNVVEMVPDKKYVHNGIDITGVSTQHNSARGALGYIIQGSWSVYFPGDTALNTEKMGKIGREFDIDVALLPIGCYLGYFLPFMKFSLKAIHMSPDEVRSAHDLLQPKMIVPIHWGTFIIGTEPVRMAMRRLKEINHSNILPLNIIRHGKFQQIDVG